MLSSLTGPHGGLVSVNQTEKHLSASDPEINFIDNLEDECGIQLIYFNFTFNLNNIVSPLDNGGKKVSTSTNDMTDGTLNIESKPNILKKLSKF